MPTTAITTSASFAAFTASACGFGDDMPPDQAHRRADAGGLLDAQCISVPLLQRHLDGLGTALGIRGDRYCQRSACRPATAWYWACPCRSHRCRLWSGVRVPVKRDDLRALRLDGARQARSANIKVQPRIHLGEQRRAGQIAGGEIFRLHPWLAIRGLQRRCRHGIRQAQEIRAGLHRSPERRERRP